jgi:hypothetical protein
MGVSLQVQFFGGPLDGECRAIPGTSESFTERGLVRGRHVEDVYVRRRVNGAPAEASAGVAAFDFMLRRTGACAAKGGG